MWGWLALHQAPQLATRPSVTSQHRLHMSSKYLNNKKPLTQLGLSKSKDTKDRSILSWYYDDIISQSTSFIFYLYYKMWVKTITLIKTLTLSGLHFPTFQLPSTWLVFIISLTFFFLDAVLPLAFVVLVFLLFWCVLLPFVHYALNSENVFLQ